MDPNRYKQSTPRPTGWQPQPRTIVRPVSHGVHPVGRQASAEVMAMPALTAPVTAATVEPAPVIAQAPVATPPPTPVIPDAVVAEMPAPQETSKRHPKTKPKETTTISIRLTIPDLRKIKIPAVVRENRQVWFFIGVIVLFIFTVGFQMGASHARHLQPAVTYNASRSLEETS